MATSDEQEVLAQYVGWGGLPMAFDEHNVTWAKEHKQLKELLSPPEYEAARESVLNAHYTSPTVIRAVYEAIGNMGFTTGNILEPSCGTGNFFGCLRILCPLPVCMAWNWIPLLAGLQNSFIQSQHHH